MPRSPAATSAQDVPSSPIMNVPPPHVGGGVGNEFIWAQLSEIQKCLGKLEQGSQNVSEKLDSLDTKMSGRLSTIDAELADIKQIRHTAKVVAWLVGIVGAVLVTAVGWISAQVWDVVKPAAKQMMLESIQAPPVTSPPKK